MFTYMRPVWAVRGVWEIYKRTFNWISKSRYLGLQPTKTHREYPETALDRPWSEFRNFPLRTHVCHLHVFGQSSLVVCYPALENIGIDGLLKPVFKMVVFWSIDGSCPFRDLPEQNQSGVNEQCPGLLLKETYGWASSVCNGLCQIDYTPQRRESFHQRQCNGPTVVAQQEQSWTPETGWKLGNGFLSACGRLLGCTDFLGLAPRNDERLQVTWKMFPSVACLLLSHLTSTFSPKKTLARSSGTKK